MRAVPCSLIAACAAALAIATSCSGSAAHPQAATVGRWVASPASVEIPAGTTLSGSNPSLERVMAVPGGWAALGTVDDGTAVAAWRSADGIHWRLTQHDPITAANGFPSVNTIVARGDDLVAAGSSTQHPSVWTSRDRGTSWSQVVSPALAGAGEISAATVVHGIVVLAGSHTIGAESSAPAAWTMRDLTHVSRAAVPTTSSGGSDVMLGVVAVGSRVIAVGEESQRSATWVSEDAGTTWKALHSTAAGGILQQVVELRGRLVASGEQFVSGGNEAAAFVWQANPDGTSWRPIPRSTGAFGDGHDTRVGGLTPFRSAAIMTGVVSDRADPNFCYDDLATCDSQSPALLLSTDGRTWGRVAVTAATDNDSFSTVAADASGLLVIGMRFDPLNGTSTNRVWRWTGPSAAVPSSVVPPEEQPKKPQHELITDYNARLDIGRTYRFPVPLGTSCGGGTLSFNSTMWKVEQPWGEGPYPKTWPVRHTSVSDGPTDYLYGTVRIVDSSHLQVGIENGPTLRTYTPTTEHQVPCA